MNVGVIIKSNHLKSHILFIVLSLCPWSNIVNIKVFAITTIYHFKNTSKTNSKLISQYGSIKMFFKTNQIFNKIFKTLKKTVIIFLKDTSYMIFSGKKNH